VVEELGPPVERADRREATADHAEVEGGDGHSCRGAREDSATSGEERGQHDAPSERDDHVGGATGDD
jgi:hypothetical protein